MPKDRRETPGRTVTWATTEQLRVHFGLADKSNLPGIEELKAAGLIGPRPDFTLSEEAALASAEEAEDQGDADEREDAAEPEDEPEEAGPVAQKNEQPTAPEP